MLYNIKETVHDSFGNSKWGSIVYGGAILHEVIQFLNFVALTVGNEA